MGVVVEADSRTRRPIVCVVPLPSGEATVRCVSSVSALTRAKVDGADDSATRSPTVTSVVKHVPPLPHEPEPTIAVVALAVVVPAMPVELAIVLFEKSHELAAMRAPRLA